MGEIEAFLSTSDEALISKGYTLEEIEENRDIFYGVSQKTESNLMEELGCSSCLLYTSFGTDGSGRGMGSFHSGRADCGA